MRRSRALAGLSLLALLPAGAWAQSAAEEQAQVEEQILTRKAALSLLEDQKLGVLDVLELVEKLAAGMARRSRVAERELERMDLRVRAAESEEAVARAGLDAAVAELSPRLLTTYRLVRRAPLEGLLSARDASGVLWRVRAMQQLVQSDLKGLEEVARAVEVERRSREELDGIRSSLGARVEALKAHAALANRQRAELVDALELIRARASQSSRAIRELKEADRELSRLVAAERQSEGGTGFVALRGQLPMPADGPVQVGFGKVVNPKFNTAVAQKGWDIGAPAGAPVRAVASGRVVYAGWLKGYGNLVILEHGQGFHTLMAHLGSIARAVGDPIRAGEEVGSVGDTGSLKGPYLYFEVRQGGEAVDPASWIHTAAGGAAPTSAYPVAKRAPQARGER